MSIFFNTLNLASELQLKDTLEELQREKNVSSGLAKELDELKRLSKNTSETAQNEDVQQELLYDPGPGPFVDYAEQESDSNIIYTEGNFQFDFAI